MKRKTQIIIWLFTHLIVILQPTLGTRAPSPASVAGQGARVPRQSDEITVSYIEDGTAYVSEALRGLTPSQIVSNSELEVGFRAIITLPSTPLPYD